MQFTWIFEKDYWPTSSSIVVENFGVAPDYTAAPFFFACFQPHKRWEERIILST